MGWNAADYRDHAGFVPALGAAVLELLAPRPGERILDLGCGDGVLTEQIVVAGATVPKVLGVDPSLTDETGRWKSDGRLRWQAETPGDA